MERQCLFIQNRSLPFHKNNALFSIKSLDFGFGSAGAIVMTVLVLILSSVYIKRAIS